MSLLFTQWSTSPSLKKPDTACALECFYSEEKPKEFNWIASQVRAYRDSFRLENDLEADHILEHIIRHINAQENEKLTQGCSDNLVSVAPRCHISGKTVGLISDGFVHHHWLMKVYEGAGNPSISHMIRRASRALLSAIILLRSIFSN